MIIISICFLNQPAMTVDIPSLFLGLIIGVVIMGAMFWIMTSDDV